MLALEGVRVVQGSFTLEADLSLAAGARVAVIGPSGAGKSTLLDVIAGFYAPQAGRVRWEGRDLTALAPQARPVSMLFQDGNLFPHLSVARNLSLALRPDGGRLDAAQRGALARALARVGLEGMEDRRPGQLSGGQQARAALARVLLQDRPVMLLDEPFAALGPALKAEMLTLVGEMAESLAALVLMVSHEPQDARVFAGHCVLVAEGRAEPPVPTGALFADPPPALKAYLG